MREDAEAEKRVPDYASAPINKVDTERMHRWAKYILGHGPDIKKEFEEISDYTLLSKSCAGLVIRALLVGTNRDKGIISFLTNIVPQPLDCEVIAKWMTGETLMPQTLQRLGL